MEGGGTQEGFGIVFCLDLLPEGPVKAGHECLMKVAEGKDGDAVITLRQQVWRNAWPAGRDR